MAADVGLTHIALPCTDLDRTIAFYARYADMAVVHRRVGKHGGPAVAWVSDHTRPFVIVFLETGRVDRPLGPFAHVGVAVESRVELDRRVADAKDRGIRVQGPFDDGPPVGVYALLSDPDGHQLELSYGQEVGLTMRERVDPG